MTSCFIPYIMPFLSVEGLLIQAIEKSEGYREAAQGLLDQAWALDAHLCPAFEAEPSERGGDYFLNLDCLDWDASREIFLAIRGRKQEIDARYELLGHAACLLDYISHMTTNVYPMMGMGKTFLATSPETGAGLEYADPSAQPFGWSLAIHMGLSPFPIFGTNISYEDPAIASALAQFGLGTMLYLSLALEPELARAASIPSQILTGGISRPAAPRPLATQTDGSLVLRD